MHRPTPIHRHRVRQARKGVYTVKDVASMLGIRLGAAYALVRDGTIPTVRLDDRWVIPKRRLHAWLTGVPASDEPVGRYLGAYLGKLREHSSRSATRRPTSRRGSA
jgi:excisionase family DNA binding protein